MTKEKIALSMALEVMECECEKYRFWAYSELNENDNWERMTYEDAINTIRKMIEDKVEGAGQMNNQIKDEGLTDAYLLGKYDGIKQGRVEAISEIFNKSFCEWSNCEDCAMWGQYDEFGEEEVCILEQLKLKEENK